eukprot:Skav225100  [mRNA]  locus=scaffold621:555304:562822:- [translate_table: standard]
MELRWRFLLAVPVLHAVATAPELELDSCDGALELRQLRATAFSPNETAPNETEEDAELLGTYSPEDALEIFLAAQPDYNETPSLTSSQGSHTSRHGGHIKYLYHQTSTSAGPQILRHGFRRGHIGWCGGGIYFALSKGATYHKAVGVDSHHGFIIEAKVDLGRTKYMPKYCTSSPKCWGRPVHQAIRCLDRSYQGGHFQSDGYDSIYFNPGDGGEYMIWDSSRVLSMKRV